MSDALAMPGDMVSPNNITLKDGYMWEVRDSGSCLNTTAHDSTHAQPSPAAHTSALHQA